MVTVTHTLDLKHTILFKDYPVRRLRSTVRHGMSFTDLHLRDLFTALLNTSQW